MKDYYYILGVKPEASHDEIRTAYRKLSIKLHPDKNDGDKFFTERFKDIQEAWEVLGDDTARNDYDYEKFGGKNRNELFIPEIILFKANQSTFDLDDEISFRWETVNADKVTLQPFGSVAPSGSNKYRIKMIKSAMLNFELIAENTGSKKVATSMLSLTKRTTYTPPPPPPPPPPVPEVDKFDLFEWMDEHKKKINNVLEVLSFLIASVVVLLISLPVIKLALNENSYEPLSIRYLLNKLGGNWKEFRDWVYDPQSHETINTLTGWLFKFIFKFPSAIPFVLLFLYITLYWFKFLVLVIKSVSLKYGTIAGACTATALVIWMIYWFV